MVSINYVDQTANPQLFHSFSDGLTVKSLLPLVMTRQSDPSVTGKPCKRGGVYTDTLVIIAQQPEQKGIEKGILPGEQNGIEKSNPEVASTMLQNGIDRSTVMKMTGPTEDDLAQIRHY